MLEKKTWILDLTHNLKVLLVLILFSQLKLVFSNKALQVLKFERFQLLLRYIQLHAPVKVYTLLRLIYQVLKYAPIKTEMFDILRIHFKNQNFRRISQSNKEIFSEAAFQSILARYLV